MDIVGIECKNIAYAPADVNINRPDLHLIKEVIHFKDGTKKPNLRLIKDFKKPVYVTIKNYRNHKDKKESELLDKLLKIETTQSNQWIDISKRLGLYVPNNKVNVKLLRDSPYVYGTDVGSWVHIKHMYKTKYPDLFSKSSVCALDTETSTKDESLLMLTIAMGKEFKTYIRKDFVKNQPTLLKELDYLYNKYIPDDDVKREFVKEFIVVENELEIVTKAFEQIHKWQPDFVAIWNLDFDISVILKVLERYDVRPEDIFTDPLVPKEWRYFKYQRDDNVKETVSGVNKPPAPQERWHIVKCLASFYVIDAMCAYNYIRVGSKLVPGGYSLDNILSKELGSKLKKIKYDEDEEVKYLLGVEWHTYMQSKRPLHYIIYNVWDVLSMLMLDRKTGDLETSMSTLAEDSSYEIFKSNPKMLIDAIYWTYLENGRVLGTRGSSGTKEGIVLSDWIVMLPATSIVDDGMRVIEEDLEHRTNTRGFVFDSDQTAGYPSNSQAINISKDTMMREIIYEEGDIGLMKRFENINLMFGKVNSVKFCTKILKFPKLEDL